jgi:hypothetical protein
MLYILLYYLFNFFISVKKVENFIINCLSKYKSVYLKYNYYNMLKLAGIGLISFGLRVKISADDEFVNLTNKIKNEKTYIYPHDITKLSEVQTDMPDNIIVKIPHNLIDKKYSIGVIKLNRLTTKTSTIIQYDESGRIKIISNDEIKKEPFQSHLLFPTKIFKEFELNPRMFESNKIKILFNNTITSKSVGCGNLLQRYSNIVENSGMDCSTLYHSISSIYSIPSMHSMALTGYDFELKENFIRTYDDVFLIVNPHKQISQLLMYQEQVEPNIKLNIVAISDDKDKIIKEKYWSDADVIANGYLASFLFIASGIILLFVE